jgi:hypothetical protein
MISKVPMEDADGLMLNETIKAGDDTAMAGSEDCLHLAVFTPRVKTYCNHHKKVAKYDNSARRLIGSRIITYADNCNQLLVYLNSTQ